LNTSRVVTSIYTIHAEVALDYGAFLPSHILGFLIIRQFPFEISGCLPLQESFFNEMAMAVGACEVTTATADANITLDANYSVFPLKTGAGWTHTDTGRIFTVIAKNRQEFTPSIGIFANLSLMNLSKINVWRSSVRRLAGDCACLTAYANLQIDYHT